MFYLQELEQALGEVEFKDGIPDVKFSRVRVIFNKMGSNWIMMLVESETYCLWMQEIDQYDSSWFWTNLDWNRICIIHYLKLNIIKE